MANIVGISGSLRKYSFNAGLLRAAAEAVPEDSTLVIESIKGIPLYDGDVEEAEGIPTIVSDLKERIATADGLLMVTPENNNSIPGVFKNTIDWLTRPPADRQRIFGNLPIGLMGVTPGSFGTAHAGQFWHRLFTICMASSVTRIRSTGMGWKTYVGQRCYKQIRRKG